MEVGFNKDWANKHSKAEFIAQHEHHADDIDLGAAWEELQEKPEKAEKAKKVAPAEEPAK